MLMLAAAATTAPQPDYILIAMVAVLALIVVIAVIRKAVSNKKASQVLPVEEVVEAAPEENAPTAPGTAGEVKLHNVEPKIAAMLMAIVADKLGKPLNELRFISIKEVE